LPVVDQGRRHGVDMSTPLLSEIIPKIDANPVFLEEGVGSVMVWSFTHPHLSQLRVLGPGV